MAVIDEVKNDQAGIKHATIEITGEYAYGWCKYETGIHRMVRLAKFSDAVSLLLHCTAT